MKDTAIITCTWWGKAGNDWAFDIATTKYQALRPLYYLFIPIILKSKEADLAFM